MDLKGLILVYNLIEKQPLSVCSITVGQTTESMLMHFGGNVGGRIVLHSDVWQGKA